MTLGLVIKAVRIPAPYAGWLKAIVAITVQLRNNENKGSQKGHTKNKKNKKDKKKFFFISD
jgi:hypothetical protein